MIKIGIIGLPNVGKSTLFNAITNSDVESANYPFATIDPNISIIDLKDERVDFLVDLYKSKIKKYNKIQFYDIAGLVKNAHKGEGLGNKFLNNIKEVDALIHLIRLFKNDEIVHVESGVNPLRDLNIINLELVFSDLEQVTGWIQKNRKKIEASNNEEEIKKLKFMQKLRKILENEDFLYNHNFTKEENIILKNFNFLTNKPMLYVFNVAEEELASGLNFDSKEFINEFLKDDTKKYELISAQIESDISKLDEESKKEFLTEFNLNDSGINNISKKIYELLDLETFFTAGEKEVRAWQIKKGTLAPQAAGLIHSDIERGFIKAEIFSFNDLKNYLSEVKLRKEGLIYLQGRDYIIKDGDICNFKFNV